MFTQLVLNFFLILKNWGFVTKMEQITLIILKIKQDYKPCYKPYFVLLL